MRAHAAGLFYYSHMAHAAAFMRPFFVNDLPILAYHRVCDVPDEDRYPFDIELVSASVAEFSWQMEYVANHFTPITFSEFLLIVESGGSMPPRPVIVTFDDGFDDNYINAYPVLKRFNVPATIFLATGYVGKRRTFWYDWLAYILMRVPDTTWRIPELNLVLPLDTGRSARRRALRILLDAIKEVSNDTRLVVLNRIDKVWGACYDGPELALSRPLTWEQVREMAAAGIEFGSHSVTHPILTSLGDRELRFELDESRRMIEAHLRERVDVLCYPVGRSFAFDRRVIGNARSAGYRLGVSYERGTNNLGTAQAFGLKRICIERFVDRGLFAAMLSLPEVFAE